MARRPRSAEHRPRFIRSARSKRGSSRASSWPCGTSAARRPGCRWRCCWAASFAPQVEVAACMGIQIVRAGRRNRRAGTSSKASARSRPRPAPTCTKTSRWSAASATPSATSSSCGSIPTGPTRRSRPPSWPGGWSSTTCEYLEQPIPAEPLSDAAWLRQQTRDADRAQRKRHRSGQRAGDPARPTRPRSSCPTRTSPAASCPASTIGHICEAAGIPCIMHCGHDLGPKTAAMLHVAAACPAYSLANDTTYYGLEDDIITERAADRPRHDRRARAATR